ncbi:MocR-like pyridoxine biosynthesis transcription factor PdxR [Streptomyces sp. NBC_00503]|uniref:MocR-like pyridoxine biosynthesis transcription factor PdxR n=1 Tax=Streptomyces sp. NBC_00503 TaxID=2903659 RepID=UPI002E80321E|nr:PLP-dependent aminotransferase family protein [Streptomyces sp. NBC_00503]WUD84975.1 PLP-dependent aminotransferase family protein [Streptomyces sp. NBC_00503]
MGRSKENAPEGSKTEAGSDFLQLDIGRAPAGGRTDWLADQLRAAIADGRLPVGSRLPATRILAAELRVSRGLVTEAYQRLAETGQVDGRGRAGTVVVAAPPPVGPPAPPPARGGLVDALRAVPCRIDLSPGVPDLASFPRTAWLQAERRVLDGLTPADFGYGNPQGTPALREAIVGWLALNRGIRADPGEVVVVAGVAQALGLLAQVLHAQGVRRVAVEDPGSLGARQQLEHGGMELLPVPVDEGGIDTAALAAGPAQAVVLTPAHQFPTGVVLDGERRRRLLGWAAAGGIVIEDDYDAEHRYDRAPVPALRAMLPEAVCYAGSVSKLLAPALRLGWLLVPPRHLDAVIEAKRYADLGNPVLAQLVLARLMESGELERHLRFVRRRHRVRRDAMLRAIAAELPGARVHGAAAGLHLMVTFDGADFDDTALAAAALALGVKAHPLSWHRMTPGPPGLILGYAAGTTGEVEEGVAAFGAALRGLLRP